MKPLPGLLLLSLFLAALTLMSAPGHAAAPGGGAASLRVGYFVLPPHVGEKGQSYQEAPAFRYFEQLMPAMGVKAATAEAYPLPRLLQKLEAGEIDMVLMMARSPERAARFVYPRQAFFVAEPAVAVGREQGLRQVQSIEQLLNLRIGVWQEGFLTPLLRDRRLTLTRMSGDFVAQRNLRMIELGHVDAFYSPDRCAIEHARARTAQPARLRVLALPEPGVPLYSVFSRQAAPRWLRAYEAALAEQQAKSGSGYLALLGGCA